MKIIRCIRDLKSQFNNPVVTIGNFDGVHLGHRELFRRVVAEAKAVKGTSTVLTFVPHPLKVLAPERAPRLLNTYQEKERLIAASCIDVLICLPFDQELADMPAESFVREILVKGVGVRLLIIGYDYAFGRGREGDAAFLKDMGRTCGFQVEEMGPVVQGGKVFSSTLVRRHLAAGEVTEVVPLLGRHFNLEGKVVRGANRGGKLGFPTANLLTEKEILPRPGVYAVKVKLNGEFHDGVMNIGFNPTFGQERISLEVHILGFTKDIYGETLRVYFIDRLRDEMVFPSGEALAGQISKDIHRAREILGKAQVVEYREYLDCGWKI